MKNQPVPAGSLVERIVIERGTTTVVRGDKMTTWAALFELRAELQALDVSEEPDGAGSKITTEATFLVRYRPEINVTDRVRWGGEVFDIIALKTVGRRQGLQITCERFGR